MGPRQVSTTLAILIIAVANVFFGKAAKALEQETLLLLTEPLNLQVLEPGAAPTDGSIVTANTVSQTGLTIPSLWWAQQQFGGKLLSTWIAYARTDGIPRHVDLVINQQVWSAANYMQRYTFVNQFGIVAQDYGYSTRVFNRQQELLAAYICEAPEELAAVSIEPTCNIFLESGGQGRLGGQPTPFGGGQPIDGGIR
jgi:hypothetical protein